MATPNTELQIRITADEKNVVGAFRRLKTSVEGLKKDFAGATAAVSALAKEANTGKARMLEEAQAQAGKAAQRLEEARRQLEYFKRQAEIGGATGMKAFGKDIDRARDAVKGAGAELVLANKRVAEFGTTAATALPQYAGRMEEAKNTARGFKTELIAQSAQLERVRRAMLATGVASVSLNRDLQKLSAASAPATGAQWAAWAKQAAGGGAALGQIGAPQVRLFDRSSLDAKPIQAINAELARTGDHAQAAQRGLGGMAKEFSLILKYALAYKAVNVFVQALADIHRLADEYASLQGRLALVTDSQQSLGQAMGDVRRIALETGSDVNATGALYQRLMTSSKQLGLAQADVARVTSTVNKAYLISGASAQEAAGSVRQLQQALASGVLRGDEFNSVMENAPRLQQGLADALGVTAGELRGMAEQGRLTSKIVAQAILEMSDSVEVEAERMPKTLSRAGQNFYTQWEYYIGGIDAASGASEKLTAAIGFMAENLDTLVSVLAGVVAGGITALITRYVALAAQKTRDIALTRQQIVAENALAAARARAVLAGGAEGLVRTKALADLAVANAAIARAGTVTTILGRAVGFLGGPVGAIVTLLSVGATLWATWGDHAKTGMEKANEEAESLAKVLEKANAEKQKADAPQAAVQARQADVSKLRAEHARAERTIRDLESFAARSNDDRVKDQTAGALAYYRQQVARLGKEIAKGEEELRQAYDLGISASTQLFIQAGQTEAQKVANKLGEIRAWFDREKAKLNKADPRYQETLAAMERSLAEQLRQATPKNTEFNTAIEERIKGYQDLADAAQDAFRRSLRAEESYRDRAARLRDQAEASPVGQVVEDQALAMLDLLAAEEKLRNLRGQPDNLEAVERQSELVQSLARNLTDQARAQEAVKNAKLAEAKANEQAAEAEKNMQAGLREEQQKAQQVVLDLKAALDSLAQGTPIKVESEGAKIELDLIAEKLAALKDKTITVQVVQQDAAGYPVVPQTVPVQARALGGAIYGPGGPTADKVPALLSAGEHVVTAAEVRAAGGHEALYRLRAMLRGGLLPKFAMGGAVGVASQALSGLTRTGPVFPHLGTLDFKLGGNSYPIYAAADVASQLRSAALQTGGRR